MFDYPNDVNRFVRVLSERGVQVSPEFAESIWLICSDVMAAGWLCPPDDDAMLASTLLTQIEIMRRIGAVRPV